MSLPKIKNKLSGFDGSIVPVVTGFIAHDEKGRVTTLGRGGSDLTATVVGSSIPVDEIQVRFGRFSAFTLTVVFRCGKMLMVS